MVNMLLIEHDYEGDTKYVGICRTLEVAAELIAKDQKKYGDPKQFVVAPFKRRSPGRGGPPTYIGSFPVYEIETALYCKENKSKLSDEDTSEHYSIHRVPCQE